MRGLYGLSNYMNYAGMMSAGTSTSSASSLYNSLSEYSSIRNGSYRKLVKAYYKKMNQTEQTDKTSNSSAKKNSAGSVSLSAVKAEATELSDAAKKLTTTGKNSLFSNSDKYDKDAAYKAVNAFVNQYNDTVDSMKTVTGTAVKNAGGHMQNMTNIMSKGLAKVGITVDTDGKMVLDEKTFKDADMSKVKSLFNGSSSYAGMISTAADRIASQANNQIGQLSGGLYGQNGYYNSYYSGSLYNSYF